MKVGSEPSVGVVRRVSGQCAVLEPLLPVAVLGRPSLGPTEADRWDPLAYAHWRPRRDLPPEYGPRQTVYGLFRRWQREGVWAAVLTGLQDFVGGFGVFRRPVPSRGGRTG
ncbi:transposase [Streptomyces sp. NPDC055955]|uniref:transposase n=1 Tax=Streptomyces sp. NPDC055955 TaxID=3345665 RepID=UPI0035D74E8F